MKNVLITCTYIPTDYFEGEKNFQQNDFDITIKDGQVEVKISHEAYEQIIDVNDKIEKLLLPYFLSERFFTYKKFTLKKDITIHHPNGSRSVFASFDTSLMVTCVLKAKAVGTDKNGNIVISENEKNEQERKKNISRLISKYYSNNLLERMLNSYENAINDPSDELVHLYEIKEALHKEFKKEEIAYTKTKVGKAKWKAFKRIANNSSLKQSRHRGGNTGKFRNATQGELEEVRNVAFNMIEGYLDYLESIN